MDIDLTPTLLKKMASYPRTIGRYNSSELYGIVAGYVTPALWFSPKNKTPEEALRMWKGVLIHDHVQRLLPTELNEIKKEYRKDGITLVAKVDHLPNHVDSVWEFKSSDEYMKKSKPSHDFQARLYCTIFERPFADIYQPVSSPEGLWLKHLHRVNRDDKWFDKQFAILKRFHEQILEYSETEIN